MRARRRPAALTSQIRASHADRSAELCRLVEFQTATTNASTFTSWCKSQGADAAFGAAQTSVDTGADCFSGRCCGRVDGLKLDRAELAQGALATFAVVLRLDPGHDRQPEFLPGSPPPSIENVLL